MSGGGQSGGGGGSGGTGGCCSRPSCSSPPELSELGLKLEVLLCGRGDGGCVSMERRSTTCNVGFATSVK